MANKNAKSGSGWGQGLQKVGNVYHYRFMHKGTIIKGSTGTSVHQEAKEFLRRLRNMKALEKVGIMSVPTLRAILEQWKIAKGPLVCEQHLMKATGLARHFAFILDRRIDQIKNPDIDEIKRAYMSSSRVTAKGKIIPHKTGGLNDILKVLKAILNFGVDRGYLDGLPCRIKKEKVKKVRRPFLDMSQVIPFLRLVDAHGREHHRMAIRLMLGLGLREKEAREARWEWLDRRAGTYTPGMTKAGEATPLPLPQWVSDYLEAVNPGNPGSQIQGLIIPNRKGLPYSQAITAKTIRIAGEIAGIAGLTPHRMRASFVTQLAENQVSLKTLQELGRHKDVTTSALYMELAEGAKEKAISERDDKILGRAPKP